MPGDDRPVRAVSAAKGSGGRSDVGPFAMVPEWVLDHPGISDGAVRQFGILARHANADDKAWPSRRKLAERQGVSVKTVDRRNDELLAAGAIEIGARFDGDGDRTSNEYRVLYVGPGGVRSVATVGAKNVARGGVTDDALNESHSEREPLNEGSSQGSLLQGDAPKAKKPKARDPIFDALTSVYPAGTRSEQSLTGMVAHELRAMSPIPDVETIVARARWAKREWPTSTVRAVATNWSAIGDALARGRRSGFVTDPEDRRAQREDELYEQQEAEHAARMEMYDRQRGGAQ